MFDKISTILPLDGHYELVYSRIMEDKKIRLQKIREALRKIPQEVDMEGIVFFAAVCPNDETPEDVDTPAFYFASGEQIHIASLLGNTLGDMMLKVEEGAGKGPDTNYRLIFLEALVASAQRVMDGDKHPGFENEKPSDEEEEKEFENDLAKTAGLKFNKKGGSA